MDGELHRYRILIMDREEGQFQKAQRSMLAKTDLVKACKEI